MKIDADKVKDLTEKAAKRLLKKLIAKLDDADANDTFGTEGWRHSLLGED